MKIPESIFRHAKTPEQVADEMRQAALVFWVARGDVAPEAASAIAPPALPGDDGTLYDVLMAGPNVGDDADFERPVDYGRELPEWDT
jgi:hypothetical protein